MAASGLPPGSSGVARRPSPQALHTPLSSTDADPGSAPAGGILLHGLLAGTGGGRGAGGSGPGIHRLRSVSDADLSRPCAPLPLAYSAGGTPIERVAADGGAMASSGRVATHLHPPLTNPTFPSPSPLHQPRNTTADAAAAALLGSLSQGKLPTPPSSSVAGFGGFVGGTPLGGRSTDGHGQPRTSGLPLFLPVGTPTLASFASTVALNSGAAEGFAGVVGVAPPPAGSTPGGSTAAAALFAAVAAALESSDGGGGKGPPAADAAPLPASAAPPMEIAAPSITALPLLEDRMIVDEVATSGGEHTEDSGPPFSHAPLRSSAPSSAPEFGPCAREMDGSGGAVLHGADGSMAPLLPSAPDRTDSSSSSRSPSPSPGGGAGRGGGKGRDAEADSCDGLRGVIPSPSACHAASLIQVHVAASSLLKIVTLPPPSSGSDAAQPSTTDAGSGGEPLASQQQPRLPSPVTRLPSPRLSQASLRLGPGSACQLVGRATISGGCSDPLGPQPPNPGLKNMPFVATSLPPALAPQQQQHLCRTDSMATSLDSSQAAAGIGRVGIGAAATESSALSGGIPEEAVSDAAGPSGRQQVPAPVAANATVASAVVVPPSQLAEKGDRNEVEGRLEAEMMTSSANPTNHGVAAPPPPPPQHRPSDSLVPGATSEAQDRLRRWWQAASGGGLAAASDPSAAVATVAGGSPTAGNLTIDVHSTIDTHVGHVKITVKFASCLHGCLTLPMHDPSSEVLLILVIV